MIQLFHVYKHYDRNRAALHDINLQIEKGEYVYITGPSGAGKSTLLKLLYCDENADEGQILIGGKNVARLRPSQVPVLRRNIGVIFQDFKLLPTKTVYENVALAMKVVAAPRREIKKRVMETLERMFLDRKRDAYPLQLSGGEQQRVCIARAMVNRPSILLADEPTGNLDSELSMEIFGLLRDINASGATMVVATHNKEVLTRIPRRRIGLTQGKIVSDGWTK
jgi:cell division transport system ATP-binding protein